MVERRGEWRIYGKKLDFNVSEYKRENESNYRE